jgi:hypothetical protein
VQADAAILDWTLQRALHARRLNCYFAVGNHAVSPS